MELAYEFLCSDGLWKRLHVWSWEEALEKSAEFGYPVRKVRLRVIEEVYYPNDKKSV